MSFDSENFESLRRLLAIKRHEQPPPGYFNTFSSDVISRLREEQRRAQDLDKRFEQAPWLLRLFTMLETKPVFAGAFGMGVCALLIAGVVYSENVQPAPIATALIGGAGSPLISDATSSKDTSLGMMPVSETTNRIASLFDQIQDVKPKPVNFSMPGGF
jgi:hypothetical protein